MSRDEKSESCDACGYETKELKFYKFSVHRRGDDVSGQWLCSVCANTMSGNANEYPSHYPDEETLHMLAYCTNLILDAIKAALKAKKEG